MAKSEEKKKKKKSKELVKVKELDLVPKKKKKKNNDVVMDVSGSSSTEVAETEKSNRVLLDVAKDDYIIVRVGKKNKLALAHSPKRNTAYIEDTLHSDAPQTFEYDADTLIANLGKDPLPGKAFGVDVLLHYGEVQTDMGPMHYYRKTNDVEKKAIRIGIKNTVKKISEAGLSKVFPIQRIEVHPPKGKWAGSYTVKFSGGSADDLVKLHPKFLEDQVYNQEIFMHEIGHAIWFRFIDERTRSEWLELYNSQTKVSKAKKSEMEDLCTSLVASSMTVRDFMGDIEGDELALFKDALAYLKRHHKMGPEDVNILLNQNSKVLASIWPTSASSSSNEALVSEYAKVSVQELFAEAFQYHMTGKSMPGSVSKLMEKSIKRAKAAD